MYTYLETLQKVEKFMRVTNIRYFCENICRGDCCAGCYSNNPNSCVFVGRKLGCSIFLCGPIHDMMPSRLETTHQKVSDYVITRLKGSDQFFARPDPASYRITFEKSIIDQLFKHKFSIRKLCKTISVIKFCLNRSKALKPVGIQFKPFNRSIRTSDWSNGKYKVRKPYQPNLVVKECKSFGLTLTSTKDSLIYIISKEDKPSVLWNLKELNFALKQIVEIKKPTIINNMVVTKRIEDIIMFAEAARVKNSPKILCCSENKNLALEAAIIISKYLKLKNSYFTSTFSYHLIPLYSVWKHFFNLAALKEKDI